MPRRFSLKPHYIKQVYSKVYSFQVFKVLIKYSRLSGQIRISYLIPSLETTRRNAIQHEARLAQRYSNDPSLWIMQNESSGVTRCFRLPVCENRKTSYPMNRQRILFAILSTAFRGRAYSFEKRPLRNLYFLSCKRVLYTCVWNQRA